MTTATTTPAKRVNYSDAPCDVPTLKTMLAGAEQTMADVLPRHLTAERMTKLVMVAANRTPKLLKCTGMTIIESVMRASELGLDCSGTLGEAYLVPYGNTCQLIPGFRGLAKLARQSGEVKRIESEVVYEADEFIYQKGTTFKLDFTPALTADRGQVVGAYALVEFKDGGVQAEFMPTAEIERIRRISKGANSGPWKDHWNEMARKTVFRRLAKWLPLSSEKFDTAIGLVDQEFSCAPHNHAATNAASDSLNAALGMDDAKALPAPEVVDEQGGHSDTSTPWQRLVQQLANRCDCTIDAATDKIVAFVGKVYKADVSELTDVQYADIATKIEQGDITV